MRIITETTGNGAESDHYTAVFPLRVGAGSYSIVSSTSWYDQDELCTNRGLVNRNILVTD